MLIVFIHIHIYICLMHTAIIIFMVHIGGPTKRLYQFVLFVNCYPEKIRTLHLSILFVLHDHLIFIFICYFFYGIFESVLQYNLHTLTCILHIGIFSNLYQFLSHNTVQYYIFYLYAGRRFMKWHIFNVILMFTGHSHSRCHKLQYTYIYRGDTANRHSLLLYPTFLRCNIASIKTIRVCIKISYIFTFQ